MILGLPSSLLSLSKVTDDTGAKSEQKKTGDEECCLSFPSMLEENQAPEQKPETSNQGQLCKEDGIQHPSITDTVIAMGNLGGSKEVEQEASIANSSKQLPMTSISGFLQSLALVSTDDLLIKDQVTVAAETLKDLSTEPKLAVDVSGETTSKIIDKIVAEVVAPKPIQTEIVAQEAIKAVVSKEQQVAVPQDVSKPLVETAIKQEASLISSKSLPNPEKMEMANPETKDIAKAEKMVAEKAIPVVKDVVLASNKPIANTYSAPEKLVKEVAPQQTASNTEVTKATVSLESANSAADTKKDLTAVPQPSDSQQVEVKSDQPEPITIRSSQDSVDISSTSEKSVAQPEVTNSMDSFNVPLEIKTSTGQITTSQNSQNLQPSISANIRQQVVEHLVSRMEGPVGNEKVTLHLNPEKLGQIEVQITAKNDALTVVLTVPEGQVEKAIHDSVKELTESLLARGGRFQQVDVKIEAKNTQGERDQQKENQGKDKDSRNQQNTSQNHDQQQQNPQQFSWASAEQEG